MKVVPGVPPQADLGVRARTYDVEYYLFCLGFSFCDSRNLTPGTLI